MLEIYINSSVSLNGIILPTGDAQASLVKATLDSVRLTATIRIEGSDGTWSYLAPDEFLLEIERGNIIVLEDNA